jgi:hypothetical protein
LWTTFFHKVHPLVRISFTSVLRKLEYDAVFGGVRENVKDADVAFLFSIYLVSAVSLSEQECQGRLGRPRADVVGQLHALCEEAITRTGLLSINEIIVLKALMLYLVSTRPADLQSPSLTSFSDGRT